MQQYLQHYIESIPSPALHSLAVCESYAARALELLPLLNPSGEFYAEQLFMTLDVVQRPRKDKGNREKSDPIHRKAAKEAGWGAGVTAVLEPVVETVLSYVRSCE
jgi:hypothetical protein